ncbi:MAG: type II toxin-antitoxin system Phd/YefM family antitoxin [Bacteroidales bacterium]|jgi:hypothetical protein|nr:type II toxin-antitoxin system Phd/YefM family antitoxin [Bacteroidales bacterium]
MRVISSSEFRKKMGNYLDLAASEIIVIHRGSTETFVLKQLDRLPDVEIDVNGIFRPKNGKS